MTTAYLGGYSREDELLLPARVEDYVAKDNLVRVIDAFVDTLGLGAKEDCLPPPREMGSDGGRPGYHPGALARLFIWGYVNRVRSTRRLETETKRNLEVIWLINGLRPDHSVISRFRQAHAKRIKRWLKEFNLVCAGLGLIGGDELSVDGVFLKVVNSKRNNHTREKLERQMKKLEERVAGYLQALEESEACAEGPGAREAAGIRDKLGRMEEAKRRAAGLLDQLEASPTGQVSTVDPESRLLKKSTSEGSVVGFLAHAAVDGRAHLIVAAEVSTKGNDRGALAGVVTAAEEVLPAASSPEAALDPEASAAAALSPGEEAEPERAAPPGDGDGDAEASGKRERQLLADGGFFDIDDLHECEQKGWTPWVPPHEEREGEKSHAKGYRRENFLYDPGEDLYRCPQGSELTRHSDYRSKGGSLYFTYYNSAACRKCPVRAICSKNRTGYRKIHRHQHEQSVERMRRRQAAEPKRYLRRAATVEHPFGSMMFWNEGRALLCRGTELAGAEFALSALAYNLKRAVKKVGVEHLVEALRRITWLIFPDCRAL